MRLEALLNEDLTDAQLKAEIKAIIAFKKELKITSNSGTKHHPFGNHKVVNGKVEHSSDVLYINASMVNDQGILKVPFRSAKAVEIMSWKLSSFINFPEIITGRFLYGLQFTGNRDGGNKIDSWEGFPKDITGNVSLVNDKFVNLSYSKFNAICQRIKGDLGINRYYVGPILSLILVKELRRVGATMVAIPELVKVCKIMNEHLSAGRDMMDCKEELMSEGLKEYAKL